MSQVRIPPVLRETVGGERELRASGDTVAAVLDDLFARYPALRERVSGWRSASERRTAPTSPPSAVTSFSPPTDARSTGGILISGIRQPAAAQNAS